MRLLLGYPRRIAFAQGSKVSPKLAVVTPAVALNAADQPLAGVIDLDQRVMAVGAGAHGRVRDSFV